MIKTTAIFIFLFTSILFAQTDTSTVDFKNTTKKPKKEKTETSDEKTNKMINCICVHLWMPVCGENGKTYSNSCFAKCAGVNFEQGSCTKVITD